MKMRNLVDELHKRCSKWLCECYGCVLIPKFESSQMVRRGKRKIRSKTAASHVDVVSLPLSTATGMPSHANIHGAVWWRRRRRTPPRPVVVVVAGFI